jgi:hypothetical protein
VEMLLSAASCVFDTVSTESICPPLSGVRVGTLDLRSRSGAVGADACVEVDELDLRGTGGGTGDAEGTAAVRASNLWGSSSSEYSSLASETSSGNTDHEESLSCKSTILSRNGRKSEP